MSCTSLIKKGGPASKPDGYLLGSYRIATAPRAELQPTHELKSTCFDSPANNVGPCPASLGCTTNSYSSINHAAPPTPAGASRLPPPVPYPALA